MLHRVPWVFALALAIVLPLAGADDKSKDDADAPSSEKPAATPPVPKGKWTAVGSVTGLLKKMNGDRLTITIEYPDTQQQKGAGAANTRLQQQLAAAAKIKNPVQRAAKIQQIMASTGVKAAGKNAPKVVTKKKDVDVTLASQIVVRVKEPPQEFDDKGKVKKYTAEELKKLKGPGNYWGYPGDPNQIKVGDTLEVFVYKKKAAPKKPAPVQGSLADKDKATDKDKDKDADKDKDKDKESDKPKADPKPSTAVDDDDDGTDPLVKVVYIFKEAAQPAKKGGGNTSPKNN